MTEPEVPFRTLRRFLRASLALLVMGGLVVSLGPLAFLTAIAETRAGRLVGVGAIVTTAMIVTIVAMVRWPTRPWLGAVSLILLGGVWGWIAWDLNQRAPSGKSTGKDGLQSYFLNGTTLRRGSFLNLLPEVDQVRLGTTMMTRLVPWMDREHARRLRRIAISLAHDVETAQENRDLGSVTYLALDEVTGRRFDVGHYYAYIPRHEPGERLGAMVFIHGNSGNFKMLPWAWRSFAESERFIIVCPSYGCGFWGRGGVEAVERVRLDALARLPIDPVKVYLAGFSDGGNGVTRTASAHPESYQGLIYCSPTMRLDELAAPSFSRGWQGRPVLIFQGDKDWNVLKKTVDPAVELLRRQGCQVSYVVLPGEDHFLFFARSQDVFTSIKQWMSRGKPSGHR